MAHIPRFDHQQIQEHSLEVFRALVALTNCPIFDAENAEYMDPMTSKTLIMCNTVILNATQPYLPFDVNEIRPPL